MLGRLALLFTENYFNAIYRIVNCNYYYSDINMLENYQKVLCKLLFLQCLKFAQKVSFRTFSALLKEKTSIVDKNKDAISM